MNTNRLDIDYKIISKLDDISTKIDECIYIDVIGDVKKNLKKCILRYTINWMLSTANI